MVKIKLINGTLHAEFNSQYISLDVAQKLLGNLSKTRALMKVNNEFVNRGNEYTFFKETLKAHKEYSRICRNCRRLENIIAALN